MMKELYLTVTEMTFLLEGEVLGYGRTVAAAAGPERPGELAARLGEGAVRMGTFLPAGENVPAGSWEATLEGDRGYALTFRGERFLLGRSKNSREVPQARSEGRPTRRSQ